MMRYSEEELEKMSADELRVALRNNNLVKENEKKIENNLDTPLTVKSNEPIGIGGWLILFYITTIFAAYRFYTSINNFYEFMDTSDYKALTDPSSSSYHYLWGVYHYLNVYGSIIFIAIIGILCFLTVKLSNKLPVIARFYYALNIIFTILILSVTYIINEGLDGILSADVQDLFTKSIASVIVSILWIFYFIKSKRVNNTFIMTKRKQGSPFVSYLTALLLMIINYIWGIASAIYGIYAIYVSFAGGILWPTVVNCDGGFKNGIISLILIFILWCILEYIVQTILSIIALIIIELFGYEGSNQNESLV